MDEGYYDSVFEGEQIDEAIGIILDNDIPGIVERAESAAETAEQYSGNPAIPKNGNWWIWDAEMGEYVDSGKKAVLSIVKSYPSVEAMNADIDNMQDGDLVIISTNDINDADNSKLYIRTTPPTPTPTAGPTPPPVGGNKADTAAAEICAILTQDYYDNYDVEDLTNALSANMADLGWRDSSGTAYTAGRAEELAWLLFDMAGGFRDSGETQYLDTGKPGKPLNMTWEQIQFFIINGYGVSAGTAASQGYDWKPGGGSTPTPIWQYLSDLSGLQGVGIESIDLTSGDHSPGTTDIYTITLTNGATYTFSVYNGENNDSLLEGGIIDGPLTVRPGGPNGNPYLIITTEGENPQGTSGQFKIKHSAEMTEPVRMRSVLEVDGGISSGGPIKAGGSLQVGAGAQIFGGLSVLPHSNSQATSLEVTGKVHCKGVIPSTPGADPLGEASNRFNTLYTKKVDVSEHLSTNKIRTPSDTDVLRFMCEGGRDPQPSDKPLPPEWGGTGKNTPLTAADVGALPEETEVGVGKPGTGDHAEVFSGGDASKASGSYSHAEGDRTTASGMYGSHSEGIQTVAQGSYGSHAEGSTSKAMNNCAHAEGGATIASGNCSHAEGEHTNATAASSHSAGYYTTASNFASHAGGHWSKTMTTGGAQNNQVGDVFVLGNGTGDNARSNAFRVTYTGEVYGLSAFNSTGADYAEYFEWEDGNENAEDRVGYFVTLKGKKIALAGQNDFILGIVSGNPCIIGNSDEDWLGRYLHDDFGRFAREEVDTPVTETVMEEKPEVDEDGNPTGRTVLVPKEVPTGEVIKGWKFKQNPDYDPTLPYVGRKERKEWDCVGMLGVLAVWDDGSCDVNGFCMATDGGIATAADTYVPGMTYRVLERVSDNVVKILFR